MKKNGNGKEPFISVIICAKDAENTIKKCIDSIIAQTYPHWEMIICDDGSSDNTVEIIKENMKTDPRIKLLVNEKNRGRAFSRNRCIQEAKYSFIAIQDADDWSHPQRFEKQINFFRTHTEYSVIGTCCYAVDEKGESYLLKTKEFIEAKDLIKGGPFVHPTFIIKKEHLAAVGNYTAREETIRSQDYHLMLKLYGAGFKAYNIQEPLYYYLTDTNTFKRSKDWKRVKGLMWIRWDGYRRNRFPFWAYFFIFKPIIVNLIPFKILERYYRNRFHSNKN